MNILLVEPSFPIPPKSRNNLNFLPIGLLKLFNYYKSLRNDVKIIRGNRSKKEIGIGFSPKEIMITSLFTYWSKYVKASVDHYKALFPTAKVIVGGIYASLMPDHCKHYTGCDEVSTGIHEKAEKYALNNPLSYHALSNPKPIDYQIIHSSRGCNRRCKFCGTWMIEPKYTFIKSIKNIVQNKKLVFYDNDILANPYIENILDELIALKKENKILWCESQSGFDGRKLMTKPYLGIMLKKAGFRYPRIAWDWRYEQQHMIKKQIAILRNSGYLSKYIYVFMIYNWNIPFQEMEKKRLKCWSWKVQIADCRYRPLNQTYDEYNPRTVGQTNNDYYIHEEYNWTDALVKQFRKNVRRQNICIRHGFPFYSKEFEFKQTPQDITKKITASTTISKKLKIVRNYGFSYWQPDKICYEG